jgi:hypothetical protein
VVQIPHTHILTLVERHSDAYRDLRSAAKADPDLATWVASEQISERRRQLVSELIRETRHTFSQANPVRFLEQLCSNPRAQDDWDETQRPKALAALWEHPQCFNRGGKPSFLALHPYHRLTSDELAKIIDWCKQVGLEFQIDADSDYFPGVTLRVCLYAPGSSALNTGIGRV